MKYEYKTKNRVSNDHFMDLHAAKNLTDLLCLDTSKLMKGFIQKSFLDPFGFIMLSDLQIKIWQVIQLNNQLWNFDATGSIIKNVRNQKAPNLYSLVVHDIIEKKVIPVAEFITTSHTINSIASNLTKIKEILESNITKKKARPI